MFKGYQIATRIDAQLVVPLEVIKDSIREAASYGSNCIRYQMVAPDPRWLGAMPSYLDFRQWNFTQYESWWWGEISNIRECCKMIIAEQLDMKIIIDCHSAYKGVVYDEEKKNTIQQFLLDDDYRRVWEGLWLQSIRHLYTAGCMKAIAGYGLCNEPAAFKQRQWIKAAKKLTKKIRQFEKYLHAPRKWIFISTGDGSVHRLKYLRPIRGFRIAIEVHLYCNGDKQEMRRCVNKKMRYIKRYGRKTNTPIFLGEIGASRFNSDDGAVAEFFGTILPALAKAKPTSRKGGGATIHALNESPQWDYRSSTAMGEIKEWLK